MDIQPEQLDFLNVKESADQMSFEGRIQKLKMPKRQEQLKHFEKLTTFANWRSDGKKKKKGGKLKKKKTAKSVEPSSSSSTSPSSISTASVEINGAKDVFTKKKEILRNMCDAFYIPSAVGKTITINNNNNNNIMNADGTATSSDGSSISAFQLSTNNSINNSTLSSSSTTTTTTTTTVSTADANNNTVAKPSEVPVASTRTTTYIDFKDTKKLQKKLPQDPVIWLTDFADTIEQHKKATDAALHFSDRMQEAVSENIKDIKLLKDKITEQFDVEKEAGHTVEGDKKRLDTLQNGMEGKEQELVDAKAKRKFAEEALEKAKKDLELAKERESQLEVTVKEEKEELAVLEKRVLRFGIQLTDGLNYCNSKIDEANRKIQLAKALEQYSEEAKKYLDEGICNEKDGTLTQMMRRIQAFVQEVKARGEHLNIFAIKYAIELLCQVWGEEGEETTAPSIIMETIKSIDSSVFASGSSLATTIPASSSSLTVVTAPFCINYNVLNTVVYYHRGVYLHTDHHVEQTKRVINCLKLLKENQNTNRNGQSIVFKIEEIDLLHTAHLPSARILRLVHAGSYIKRIHDVSESALSCHSYDYGHDCSPEQKKQKTITTTAPIVETKNNELEKETVEEKENDTNINPMEASDDEFITFDLSTSLLTAEDEEKANGIWKIVDKKNDEDASENNSVSNDGGMNNEHFSVHQPKPSIAINDANLGDTSRKSNINPLTGKRYYRRRQTHNLDFMNSIPKSSKEKTTNRRTASLGIADMLQLGIIKAGPIKIMYRGKLVKKGKLDEDSSFSCGNNTFETPSGFALHFIRKLANPDITTISGYMAIFQGDYSLDQLRKMYLKANAQKINELNIKAKTDQVLENDVNSLLDARINSLRSADGNSNHVLLQVSSINSNGGSVSRFPRSRTAIASDLSLRNMMKHGFLKPQPVTVLYHQAHRTGGKITAKGTFEVDGESWETPSGFALYIAKKVNPNLRTINGFSAVRINNVKLSVYRDKFKVYIAEEKKRRDKNRNQAVSGAKSEMKSELAVPIVTANPIEDTTTTTITTTNTTTTTTATMSVTDNVAQSLLEISNDISATVEPMNISDDEKHDNQNELNISSSSAGTTVSTSGSYSNDSGSGAHGQKSKMANIYEDTHDNQDARGRTNSTISFSSMEEEYSNVITPANNFVLNDEDNTVTSLSGGLEYWLLLGGKLSGMKKGRYIQKLCRIDENTVAWLPAVIVRNISDTEYKIKFVQDIDGVRSSKLSSYLDVSVDVWRKDENDDDDNGDKSGRSSRRRKKIPSRYRDIPLNQKQFTKSRKRSVSSSSINSTTSNTTKNKKKKRKSSTSWTDNGYGNENGDADDEQDENEVDLIAQAMELQNPLEGTEDTFLSSGSHIACLHAAGVVCKAVDDVMRPKETRTLRNAFCLVRPPGHHVGRFGRTVGCCSHGFCLMNNVGIGAMKARVDHDCKKIAIIDFDVHFGNGTYEIFRNDKDTLFISVHMTGDGEGNIFFGANLPGVNEIDTVNNNICISIEGGKGNKGRTRFSTAFLRTVLPALKKFNPELIMISAGFDGHKDDPLGGHLGLIAKDFRELTYHVVKLAEGENMACQGRVVSVLEGGYDCKPQGSLPKCVVAHVKAMAEKNPIFDERWKKDLVVDTSFMRVDGSSSSGSAISGAMNGDTSRKRGRSRRSGRTFVCSPTVSLSSPTRSPQNNVHFSKGGKRIRLM